MSKKKVLSKSKGKVEIRMVNPKKTGTITLRDYRDSEGILREFKDRNGEPRVKRYTKAVTILNLDDEDMAIEYEHVKDHPIYIHGPYPVLKVVDTTKEAIDGLDKFEQSIEALNIVRELSDVKIKDFARVLAINATNANTSVVRKAVYDIAQDDPKRFLEEWNDPNKSFKQILHKGLSKGVFTNRSNTWKYRDLVMGISIDQALLWLTENEDLLPSIREEINK